jgi:hypothetical protein
MPILGRMSITGRARRGNQGRASATGTATTWVPPV